MKKYKPVVPEKEDKEYPEKVIFEFRNRTMIAEGKEAKKILVRKDKKAQRMIELGFTRAKGAKEVKQAEIAERKRVKLEKIRSRHKEYTLKYPLYKFITEDQINAICKKYDLYFGQARDYKGDIPEKNLREIEKFNINPEDRNLIRIGWWGGRAPKFEKLDEVQKKNLMEKGKITIITKSGRYTYRNIFGFESLHIVAPKEEFALSNRRIRGRKIVQAVADPVVLMPMSGGLYAIVTAWGDEASDHNVVNEKKN